MSEQIEQKGTNLTTEEKKDKRNKSLLLEIIRFGIVGVICAVIEMAFQYVIINYICKPTGLFDNGTAGYYGSWAIAYTFSFIVSVLVNYVLSRVFVYKNVSKDADTKSAKAFWIYFWLAVGGWLIGLGIFELLVLLCNLCFGISVDPDMTKGFSDAQNAGNMVFWSWLIIFAIKTLIVMFYNYLTRKIIIFKQPKEGEEKISEGDPMVVKEKEEIVSTKESAEKIETETVSTPKKNGKRLLIRKEINQKVDKAIKEKDSK